MIFIFGNTIVFCFPTSAHEGMFTRRLKHWIPDADGGGFQWFVQVMKELAGYKAWNLSTSYVTSIFNCWHASTRQGNSPIPCLFGCQPYIGPCREYEYNNWGSLGHYLTCPVVDKLHRLILPDLAGNSGARFRLGLGRNSMVQDLGDIVFMDGLHSMYNFTAHSVSRPDPAQMHKLILSRMGASVDGKPALRAFINSVVLWKGD